jgi:eukaryotic-like serine/threonine-protein kinase
VALLLRAGERIGPYRLEERVGEGAVGIVYRATVEARVVALKVLRPELAGNALYRRRLDHEARVARGLRHPNLVAVIDTGESAGLPWIASRFAEGPSLAGRLRAEGRLAVEDVLRVAGGVGAGLTALHRHGLVHRDVKPSNVLLASDGTPLVTDFGLAKGEALTALTRPGQVVGTPQYLAPELVEGSGEASPASDVYALGCVVFECLAGRPPFTGSVLEVALAHLEEEPPPLEGFSPGLGEAVLTALAKDAAARPRTPTMYAHLLRAAADAG